MVDPLIALIIGILVMALLSLLFWPRGGLIGHLQRVKKLDQRVQREDALKFMHKAERTGQEINPESVAKALQINRQKAAQTLQDMQDNQLAMVSGAGFQLTPSGQQYALKVIRAHRLWERYLAEETGFEEAKWHDLAERYEHQLTPQQVDALAAQLGNPTHDPHGDPIPTAEVNLWLTADCL